MDRVISRDKTAQLAALLHSSLEQLANTTGMGVTLLRCDGSMIDALDWPQSCAPSFAPEMTSRCFTEPPRTQITTEPTVTHLSCQADCLFLSTPILTDPHQCATLLVGPYTHTPASHVTQLEIPSSLNCPPPSSLTYIAPKELPWLSALLKTSAELIALKIDSHTHRTAEKKIRESHEYLQSFFHAAPLGLVVSHQRTLIKVNKKFCEITGYSEKELVNQSQRPFYETEEEYERVYKELSHAMWGEKQIGHVESTCIRKDGSIIDTALYAAPINPKDPSAGAAVVIQDITEQKRNNALLRLSNDKLQSLFRAAPVGLAIIRDRNFYSVNEQMAHISGYEIDELTLMNVRQLYTSEEAYQAVGNALYSPLWVEGRTDTEATLVRKDGTYRELYLSMAPVDMNNPNAGVAVSCLDLTTLKKTEQDLQHHRAMVQSLFDAVPVGLAIIKNRTFISVNKALEQLLGRSIDDLKGLPTRKLYPNHEEFFRVRDLLYNKLWRTGTHNYVETQLMSADGSFRDVSLSAAAINPDNPQEGAAVAIYDQTQQKHTQKMLQLSEDRFRTIAHFSGHILYDYDIQSGNITWTGETENMTGYPLTALNELGIAGWFDQVHPADLERVKKELERTTAEHNLFQTSYRFKKADGTYIHVEEEGVPFYDENSLATQMVGIVRDITSRVKTEQELIDSEYRYRTLFESAGNAQFLLHNGIIINCNQQALKLFCCSREDLIGLTPLAISPEKQSDGRSSQEKILENKKLLRQGLPLRFEWTHQTFDGRLFEAEIYLNSMLISGIECVHANMRDITDRKKAERDLRESEFRFRSFYNTNPEGIALLNFEGIVLDTNKSFLRESGYELEQCVGYHFREFVQNEQEQAKLVEAIAALKSGIANTVPLEVSYVNAQGITVPVSVKGWLVVDNTSQPMYIGVFIRNLSVEKALSLEKAALEKQIIQAQKSEAIGTLAGGIAHDFNNILGGLIGYTELALLKMPPKHESSVRDYLQRVLEIGQRAKDLVQQILRFSRHSNAKVEPITVVPIVKESLRLLRSTIPSTISIHPQIDLKDEQILGDATQLHQIIMNLATNSYHAMRRTGGTLTISVEKVNFELCRRFLTMEIPPGEYIKLSVKDTGTGISPTVLDRMFEPYFTTKEVNEGTGLGLAVTMGLVKSHKGLIEVDTEIGIGSCFSIYLPLVNAAALPALAAETRLSLGHGERILVVDDEDYFREVIREGLSLLGYSVEVHASSMQTLQQFKQTPMDYDLLISDLTMPEMTGTDLAQRILAIRPSLPIILCTGFSETITEENASHFGIAQLLLKPINIEDMASAVHRVLAQNDASSQS
nr:PAS domain S-box protein [uncultured Desulfobulbus sp.]